MPDYKAMYFELFNSVTDAIEILMRAQNKTEEMYITSCEKEEKSSQQCLLNKSNF